MIDAAAGNTSTSLWPRRELNCKQKTLHTNSGVTEAGVWLNRDSLINKTVDT